MRRLDGVYRIIQNPVVRKHSRRFGVLILVLAMIFGLATSSTFPTITRGESGTASGNRLWSSGAELNSTTTDMEVSGTSGTFSISSGTVRSGTYSYRTNPTSSTGTFFKTWANSAQNNKFWFRTYLRIATTPNQTTGVFQIGTGSTVRIGVRLTTGPKLQLFNETGTPAQIGSDSSTLSTATWYRVEVAIDDTTSTTTATELRLDGVSVASTNSTNIGTSVGIDRLTWGATTASTTTDLFFDDLAINDSTNRSDNWPGDGKIVHIVANAAGDNTTWTRGGTDTGANYSQTNEIPPDDDTTYVATQTNNNIDDYNINSSTSAGIGSGDLIKLVSVGVRIRTCGTTGAATCFAIGSSDINYRVRLKAAAAGTTDDSGDVGIARNNSNYLTNDDDTAKLNKLTDYVLPGTTTTKWTATNIDSAQIGVKDTDGNGIGWRVSAVWLQVEYVPQSGGRVFSSGFELNSTTANVEWTSTTGSPTIVTTPVRSGTYALQTPKNGTQGFAQYNFVGANSASTDDYYFRAYLRITTAPSAEWDVLELRDTTDTKQAWITMTTSRTLKLFSTSGGSAQIGSASSALSTGTWYRIEIRFELGGAGTGIVDSRLNGSSYASATNLTITGGVARVAIGDNINGAGSPTTGQLLFDDTALNLAGGTSQSSWPGDGRIVHLKPSATGDNSGWTQNGTCTGGNFGCVNEIAPNDATNYVSATAANTIDDYNIDDPTFGANDTVNLVSVGVRFNTAAATEEDFRVRLKDAAGGVPIEGSTLAPASTTWVTNQTASPFNYSLTAYTRPEQNTSWTKSDLTNAQIGVRDVLAGTGTAEVSTEWLLVEYTSTLSGTVYQTDETTTMGSGRTVAVEVNGGDYYSASTDGSGNYTIPGVAMSPGDALTVYLDGNTEKGATFTVSPGTVTGIDIYQDRAATRCDNSCSLTNANINNWDKDNDSDIHATVTASNLTVDNDWKLLVKANTFAAGGTVTTTKGGSNTYSGDLEVKSGATLTMGSNALTVGGSFTNSGTFTTPSNTTTLNSTDATETIKSNGSSFNNLEMNSGLTAYWKMDEGTGTSLTDASGSGFTATTANGPSFTTTVPGATYSGADPGSLSFTAASNQFASYSPSTTVSGSFSVSVWARPTAATAAIGFLGTRTGSDQSFDMKFQNGNQIHGDIGNGASWITTAADASFSYSVNTWYHIVYVVTPTTYTIYANGSSVGSGSYASSTPLLYDSTHNILIAKTVPSSEYFDGQLDDLRIYNRALSSGEVTSLATGSHPTVTTYTLQDALSVSGNLAVRTGKLDVSGSNYGVSVGGNYLNVANLGAQAGAVTMTATSGTKTIQSDPQFYDLTVNGSGGTFNLDKQRLSVSDNLTITAGTLDATASGCWASTSCDQTVTGNWNNSGTFTARTSNTTLNGTSSSPTIKSNGSSFNNTTINNGLVDYFKFDDNNASTAGTVYDASGNADNGTGQNGPTYTSSVNNSSYYGNDPGAMVFSGASNQYVSLGSGQANYTTGMSISFWMFPTTTDAWQRVIDFANGAASDNIIVYRQNTTQNLVFEVYNGGSSAGTAIVNSGITQSAWQYFTITMDASRVVKIYKNGSLQTLSGGGTSTTFSSMPNNITRANNYIGKSNFGGDAYYTGRYDDLRIYNRALAAGEVTSLAAGSSPSSGDYTLQDALSVTGNLAVRTGNIDVSGSNYAVSVGGSYTNVADFVYHTGTFTLNGTAGSKTVQSDPGFYDLAVNGSSGGWTLDKQRLSVTNNFSITNGTLDASASSCYAALSCNVSVTNNFTGNSGTWTLTLESATWTISGNWDTSAVAADSGSISYGTSTLLMNGSGTKTLKTGATSPSTARFYNLQVGQGGATTQLLSSTSFHNILSLGTGTIDLNSNTLYADGGTANPLSLNALGTWGTTNGTFDVIGGTNTNLPAFTYNSSVKTEQNSGSKVTMQGTTTVNGAVQMGTGSNTSEFNTGNFTLTASTVQWTGASGIFTAGSSTVTVSAGWDNSLAGTFNANTSTITFAASGGNIDSGAKSFNLVTFTGGTWTVTGNTLTITSDLTMTGGTMQGTQSVTVNGNVAGTAGTINLTGGTFKQRVAANKNFGTTSGSGAWTFNNLTFSNSASGPGAAKTITTQTGGTGDINVAGNLLLGESGDASGATTTLNAGNRIWTLSGTGGTPFQPLASPLGHLAASTSTFNYTGNNGGGNTTVTGTTYNNLTVNNGAETYVLGAATIAGATLTITAGVLDTTGSNLALTAANVVDTDTLTLNGSTLTLNGTSGTLLARGVAGVFNANTSTVTVTSASGTVTLNSRSLTFNDLTINAGTTVPLGAIITVSDNLAISGGTLDDATHQITGNGTGTMTMSSGTTLKLGGGSATAFPTSFTTGHTTLNSASTVIYNATVAQTISGTPTYGNLQLSTASGTPTKTLGAATTVAGNLTIDSSNTLDVDNTNNYGLNLAGNYTNNGTFTARAGLVTLNGSAAQTLSGTMTSGSAFYDLTVTNASGADASDCELTSFTASIVFSGSATATHNLTFTTAHSRIQYHTGSTYTFANINWNGQASGTKIYFRNSAASGTWLLNVSGTQTAVSYINVSHSDASGGNTINAADGTNTDCGNNTNWSFANPNSPTSLAQYKSNGTTLLNTGDWTNETTVVFKASVSDGDNPASVAICVEKQPLGNLFVNTEDLCGSTVAYSGSPVTASVTITGIADATEYHWQARAKDSGGAYSAWVSYGGNAESARDFGVDTTACSAATVYDGTSVGVDADYNTGALDTLSANWGSFTCTVSGLNHYDYSIGTTAGGTDVVNWTNNSTTTSVTVGSLNLHTTQAYYFNVRATDNATNVSGTASSNGQAVLPSLTFSLNTNAITFSNLNNGNNLSDSASITLTTSTNAYGGYVVDQYAGGLLTTGSITIPMFQGGSYASPSAWGSLPCTAGSNCGYGYTSDDATIQGSNKFSSGTLYAPLSTTAPGDIVADHTANVTGSSGSVVNEQFHITHKVAVSRLQAAQTYNTTVYYIATGTF